MTTTITEPNRQAALRIADELKLLQDHLPIQRRIVHAGDAVYRAAETFGYLCVVNSGFFKIVNMSADGREQVVALHFKGDWLGLDGIASGSYGCAAVAMDTGEVWAIRYDALLETCAKQPAVLSALHGAMSREIGRDRDSMLSLCTLPADARVADFLRYWAEAVAQRGLRTDQITLRMSRAEIGNYLGMTLESVSRALSRLARGDVIRFHEKGRRDIQIPRVEALNASSSAASRQRAWLFTDAPQVPWRSRASVRRGYRVCAATSQAGGVSITWLENPVMSSTGSFGQRCCT